MLGRRSEENRSRGVTGSSSDSKPTDALSFVVVSPLAPASRARSALVVLALAVLQPGAAHAQYQIKVTDWNHVGLTVTNYGFFGNNFVSRAPSLEYPLGLGYEHMSRAGLWVGALAITPTGEAYRVTTGALDNLQGSNQSADTEWNPAPGGIVVRSSLPNNRYYRPDAVSEQDVITTYRDSPARGRTGINQEPHVPLGVRVNQAVYSFSIEPASHFVILHLTLVNEGNLLRDLHVGLYTQMVSGNKNQYSVWPPSASSGAGSWYYRHYVDWVDSLRLVREHVCEQIPPPGVDPAQCVGFDRAPYWAGVEFLGVRPESLLAQAPGLPGARPGLHIWAWDTGDTSRDTDAERYALLSSGTIDPPHIPRGDQYSPIELLTVGPIDRLEPGDSVSVDFAWVFGSTPPDLASHAAFAQFAFDLDYKLPHPPPSPRLHVRTEANQVTLLWDDSPERVPDETSLQPGGLDFEGYRVYLGSDRLAPPRVAQFDVVDTTEFNTGLDAIRLATPEIIDGDTVRYSYTVKGLRDGFSYFAGVTSFDTGDEQVPPLESGLTQNKRLVVPGAAPGEREGRGVAVFPNPYKVEAQWDAGQLVRDHYLWFANLPPRCHLSIFTLAGDLVFDTDFDGSSYHGENARGLYDPRTDLDVSPPDLSGASFAWNLISRRGQAIATGIYLFAVRDLDSGKVERGKFLVLKADREGF